ncbi:MAG: glycosyltransferase [Verrucomicrobia bacterium]|nr:glycosyltransferase [Verrucomicrobiota bacterium]
MLKYLLFLYFLPLAAYQLSEEVLRHKLSEPLPQWAQNQIEEDLRPFCEKGATREAIARTLAEVHSLTRGNNAQFVTYTIKNNQLTFETLERPDDPRITHFLEFFSQMARVLTFPDVQFLASIWDCFDSPHYLHHLHAPVFSFSKRKSNHFAILMPETREFHYIADQRKNVEMAAANHPWQTKIELAFWRGNTTGGYYHYHEWDMKPRPQVVLFSKAHPDLVDARFTSNYFLEWHVEQMFKELGLFDDYLYATEYLRYKYLIAVDGNSLASSMKWQPFSGCVILKSGSDYIDWFYKGFEPDQHYIPFAYDCSDLAEKIQWLRTHDMEAAAIAKRALAFAKSHLTWEDCALYYYHLLTAFAKLQNAQSK